MDYCKIPRDFQKWNIKKIQKLILTRVFIGFRNLDHKLEKMFSSLERI